jgi:3'(2'), 5'-bisphosphate nucleotidase
VVNIPTHAQTTYFAITQKIIEAGNVIMDIFNKNYTVDYKTDMSPVTQADIAANKVLINALLHTKLPIISEETALAPFYSRKNWKEYWIIDPLDGTKEFIKKGSDFTVNVARIVNNQPHEGYIYVPFTETFYWGQVGLGAFKYTKEKGLTKLPETVPAHANLVASKSHFNTNTKTFINTLIANKPELNIIHTGSSLKFCVVAEGNAQYYPRIGSINEWDIAAGDAIVRAAGAYTIDLITKNPILYNSKKLKTPSFIVGTNIDELRHIILTQLIL